LIESSYCTDMHIWISVYAAVYALYESQIRHVLDHFPWGSMWAIGIRQLFHTSCLKPSDPFEPNFNFLKVFTHTCIRWSSQPTNQRPQHSIENMHKTLPIVTQKPHKIGKEATFSETQIISSFPTPKLDSALVIWKLIGWDIVRSTSINFHEKNLKNPFFKSTFFLLDVC